MVVFPNAKINLGLSITARRPDGYHEIESIMVPIPWCDVLEIVESKGHDTTLTVSGRCVNCPPDKNLVMRAYKAVATRYELPAVDIFLRKIIPDGAGLGGGSSDAAFTIKSLNDMFNLSMSKVEMAAIASTLGADCPFFVYNSPMLATGIGTDLSPIADIDLSGIYIAVVKPKFAISTAEAYSRVSPHIPEGRVVDVVKSGLQNWRNILVNDFEKSIAPLYPQIEEIKSQLYEIGSLYSSMSGSGSAVYGLFQRDILSADLHSIFKNCDLFCGKLS